MIRELAMFLIRELAMFLIRELAMFLIRELAMFPIRELAMFPIRELAFSVMSSDAWPWPVDHDDGLDMCTSGKEVHRLYSLDSVSELMVDVPQVPSKSLRVA